MTNNFSYCPYDGSQLDPPDPVPDSGGFGRCAYCGFVDYGNPRPCVGIFIYEAARVLLSAREIEPARGKWDIVGGFIDARETAEAAVLREASEETNLCVEIVSYLGSLPDVYSDRQFPTLNLIYLARRVSGDLRPQGDVSKLQWFTVDLIPDDLAFAHQRQAVELLRMYLLEHGYCL